MAIEATLIDDRRIHAVGRIVLNHVQALNHEALIVVSATVTDYPNTARLRDVTLIEVW